MQADFFSQVPGKLEDNLRYRAKLLQRCATDLAFRSAMMAACKADFLFWCSAFVWIAEPRNKRSKKIPFTPWPHQIPVMKALVEHIGDRDICLEKSRGEGMSWIGVLLALHGWLFEPEIKIGMVSATEKKADDPGNMDSLMSKVCWALEQLPDWMGGRSDTHWKRNVSRHSLVNFRNNSSINAFSADGDGPRGGRYTWFLMDELAEWEDMPARLLMAATQHTTNSRLVISTPRGMSGEYYRFIKNPDPNLIHLVLDWKDNPSKNRGLYRVVNNRPDPIDPVNNPLPLGYEQESVEIFSILRDAKGFKLEGRLRSPWYDKECLRANSPLQVAQELDRDFGGSELRYYDEEFQKAGAATTRPPMVEGDISYTTEDFDLEFHRQKDGPAKLWTKLDMRNRPEEHSYVMGVDISSGLGGEFGSNSVVQVIDILTGDQVMEWATKTIRPAELAESCVAIAKWFHNAYLSWERNGPGGEFTRRMKELRYPNVYMRDKHDTKTNKKTKLMGWWTAPQTLGILHSTIRTKVKGQEIRIRSGSLLEETLQYVMKEGRIVHKSAGSSEDDASIGEAHGDRVIAFGVALQAIKDRPVSEPKTRRMTNPPAFTMAAREKEYRDAEKRKDDEWDDRENADLAM
jgi:hypothetical protein